MEIYRRNVLGSDLTEDLSHGLVSLPGRRGQNQGPPATLRESAVRRPEHSREADASVPGSTLDDHALCREVERCSDTAFALGAVPNRVLHLGAGMVCDD